MQPTQHDSIYGNWNILSLFQNYSYKPNQNHKQIWYCSHNKMWCKMMYTHLGEHLKKKGIGEANKTRCLLLLWIDTYTLFFSISLWLQTEFVFWCELLNMCNMLIYSYKYPQHSPLALPVISTEETFTFFSHCLANFCSTFFKHCAIFTI